MQDLTVIIRKPIEEFGVERSQSIESAVDTALEPLGFVRSG